MCWTVQNHLRLLVICSDISVSYKYEDWSCFKWCTELPEIILAFLFYAYLKRLSNCLMLKVLLRARVERLWRIRVLCQCLKANWNLSDILVGTADSWQSLLCSVKWDEGRGRSSKMGHFPIKWKTLGSSRNEVTSLEACEPSGLDSWARERLQLEVLCK